MRTSCQHVTHDDNWHVSLFKESILSNCSFTICLQCCDIIECVEDVKEWREEDRARGNQDLWSQISSLDEISECTMGIHPSLSQPRSSPVHYWCEAACPSCASLLLLNTRLIDIIKCKHWQKFASIASSHHPLQTEECFIWTDEVKRISSVDASLWLNQLSLINSKEPIYKSPMCTRVISLSVARHQGEQEVIREMFSPLSAGPHGVSCGELPCLRLQLGQL